MNWPEQEIVQVGGQASLLRSSNTLVLTSGGTLQKVSPNHACGSIGLGTHCNKHLSRRVSMYSRNTREDRSCSREKSTCFKIARSNELGSIHSFLYKLTVFQLAQLYRV